ncbi:hypothetical protein [Dyella sp. C11]|uniref:hypothetical protein n=1 Tax=Dyella sp. C11 TaxID=2126991 RepID=UPI00130081F1|nr:hypothetical protein [Dyella sp. C11]
MRRYLTSPASWAILLGIAATIACLAWEVRTGFNLGDEGYLWYGIQRIGFGEVPIRDYQAYDPGRYYFSAGLLHLTGTHGILAVRYTIALLQAIALSFALAWLARVHDRRGMLPYLVLCAVTLAIWMVPRHKLYDISISIGFVCALAWWITHPTTRRSFLAGAFTGLAAYFGRNHGIYGLAAGIGALIYLMLDRPTRALWLRHVGAYFSGVIVGYIPMFATMLFVPHFTASLIDSVRLIFEVKSTNLPLPLPWPWKVHFESAALVESTRAFVIGLIFLFLPAFCFVASAIVFLRRWQGKPLHPLVVASALCAIPYTHYAYSRADVSHLAQGIFPALIGVLAMSATAKGLAKYGLPLAICALSVFAVMPQHPGWQCRVSGHCTDLVIGNDVLSVDPGVVSNVTLLGRLKTDLAPAGRNLFVAPLMPGAYAVLGARSPTMESYTAWKRSQNFQQQELDRLKAANPGFLMIMDVPLDGRDELRYQNTHPLMDQYIKNNYEELSGYTNDPTYHIYRGKPLE